MTSPVQSLYNWYRSLISNPKYRWWIILGTLVYLISPFDIAPDFIPFIGQIDDAVLLSLLVAELAQVLGDRVKAAKAAKGSQTAAATDNTNPVTAETVDVNAVSVE
jgi:uncharacterized membrane protein YkvA (DUF1232 family)